MKLKCLLYGVIMVRLVLVLLLTSSFLPMTFAAADEQHLKFETKISAVFGDYDVMKKRRIIRVLIPYSKTFYFIDNSLSLIHI